MARPKLKKEGEYNERLTISLTPEARDMLDVLAKNEKKYVSNVVEELVRQSYKAYARKAKEAYKLPGQVEL